MKEQITYDFLSNGDSGGEAVDKDDSFWIGNTRFPSCVQPGRDISTELDVESVLGVREETTSWNLIYHNLSANGGNIRRMQLTYATRSKSGAL